MAPPSPFTPFSLSPLGSLAATLLNEVALPWFPWELGAGARPFCGRPAPCFGCAFGTAFFGLKCPTSDWRLVLALTFFEIFWIAPFWAMTWN